MIEMFSIGVTHLITGVVGFALGILVTGILASGRAADEHPSLLDERNRSYARPDDGHFRGIHILR